MAGAGNYCTLNPLTQPNAGTFSEGNLLFTHTASAWRSTAGTFGMRTGKWYWEAYQYEDLSGNGFPCGIYDIDSGLFLDKMAGDYLGQSTSTHGASYVCYTNTGSNAQKRHNGVEANLSFGAGAAGDVWQCAFDADNGKIWFGQNNTWSDSGNPATGTNATYTSIPTSTWVPVTCSYDDDNSENYPQNFGQDASFAGRITDAGNADGNGHGTFKYSPPSGFLSLCAANLPISSDIDPAGDDGATGNPTTQHNSIIYTGNATARSITGLGFKPDMVWTKQRTGDNGKITDSSRGVYKNLISNTTAQEGNDTGGVTAFGTDGFSIGTDNGYNQNTEGYVAWCWRANGGVTTTNTDGTSNSTVQANQAGGFSIVEYAGSLTSSGHVTIGHGLSKAPEFYMIKQPNKTGRWFVWHTGMSGANYMLELNTTAAESDKSGNGTMSLPTSTVFSTNYTEGSNENNYNNVAYVWHSVDGYSKFGKYIGNGDTDGPFIYTGFRPRMLFIRRIQNGHYWYTIDTARNANGNSGANLLSWDNTIAESTHGTSNKFDFLANGFKLRTSGGSLNGDGGDFIYGAWGDVPYKYPNTHNQYSS